MGRFLVAVMPLLLTLLFAWLTMEGHLNLGAGCKDIVLVVPIMIWSLVFLVCYIAFWWRGFTLGRSVITSSALATGLVVSAWVVLFGISLLVTGPQIMYLLG